MKKKTIKNLKTLFDGKEILDDDTLESLKKKKLKIGTDNLILAEMVLFCYSNFQTNLSKIDNKKDFDELDEYLKTINVEEIRRVYLELGKGMELGDHYKRISLDKDIEKNRKTYEELINNFFTIFEEEN